MKEMKNTERFTDKEWEELASILSDEKSGDTDILDQFIAGDSKNTGKTWKELKIMSDQREIDVDKAWNKVSSRIMENGYNVNEHLHKTRFMRTTILRIAAAALILLSLGGAAIYLNNKGLNKNITVLAGNDQKNVLVSLPDGSTVYLNRNSEFSYKKNFGRQGRNVNLTG